MKKNVKIQKQQFEMSKDHYGRYFRNLFHGYQMQTLFKQSL